MKESQTPQVRSANFYQYLPVKSQLKLFTAIFFTFAPVGILSVSGFAEQRSWYGVLVWLAISGAYAVGWAFSFIRNLKFLFVVIPIQIMGALFLAELLPSDFGFERMRFGVEGMACVGLIVLGYVFFISFINGEGAKTLRLQAEMALAQDIHSSLVPPIVRTAAQLELFGRSIPSSEMGGDLVDIFDGNGKLGLYVADAAGHGVAAGVVMGMVKSAIRMKLRTSDTLGSLLNDLNQVVCQLTRPEMFVTLTCLRFDGSSSAVFAGAGHLPILHYDHESGTVRKLASEHLPLGVSTDEQYASRTIQFSEGDLFLLMTDGLTEVLDSDDRELGPDRIEALLIENAQRPLTEIYSSIMDAVEQHGPQVDDQTLLLARVR